MAKQTNTARSKKQPPKKSNSTLTYALVGIIIIFALAIGYVLLSGNDSPKDPTNNDPIEYPGEFVNWTQRGQSDLINITQCETATSSGQKYSSEKIANGFVVNEESDVYSIRIFTKNIDTVAHARSIDMSFYNASGDLLYAMGSKSYAQLDPGEEKDISWYYTKAELESMVGDIEWVNQIIFDIAVE